MGIETRYCMDINLGFIVKTLSVTPDDPFLIMNMLRDIYQVIEPYSFINLVKGEFERG